MSLGLILPAAGLGTRLGAEMPKALVLLEHVPLIAHTCKALAALTDIAYCVVLAPSGFEREIESAVGQAFESATRVQICTGGAERADSVRIGIEALPAECDVVAVHDAARPCVSAEELHAVVEAARQTGAAILATPCTDTVKRSLDGQHISETVDRAELWLAQTPQVFERSLLERALTATPDVTDEAMAVEALGHQITLVRGQSENIKVTTHADLIRATAFLRSRNAACASE